MRDMGSAKKLLVLRALCGLAWSDDRVDKTEVDFVARAADEMGLDDDQRERIEGWIAVPMAELDARRLLRDIMRGLLDRRDRARLLELLRQLAAADGEISAPERAFITDVEKQFGIGAAFRAMLSVRKTGE